VFLWKLTFRILRQTFQYTLLAVRANYPTIDKDHAVMHDMNQGRITYYQ